MKDIEHPQFSGTAEFNEYLLAVPTTQAQREIWNSVQFDETSSLAFNESITLHFTGELDHSALKQSLMTLIERHSALKSSFSADGHYLMVAKRGQFQFSESQESLAKVITHEMRTSFDLENGPLIRFHLVKENETHYYLIMTAHHIICDGWSWAALNHDFGLIYNELKANRALALKPAYQFWQYAQSLRDVQTEIESDTHFWRELFQKFPEPLNLNRIKNRPELRTFTSKRLDTPIDAQMVKELKKKAGKLGVSFYQLMYSMFVSLIALKSGQTDIVVGISAAGQSLIGKKDLVGHCVSLLPIRIQVNKKHSLQEQVTQVKKTMLDATAHQRVSFGQLVAGLNWDRDSSRVPLVPVIFNIDVQAEDQGLSFDGLFVKMTTNPRHYENFEMFLNVTMIGNSVVLENQYNTDLFEESEMKEWMSDYQKLLSNCLQDVAIDWNQAEKAQNIVIEKKIESPYQYDPQIAEQLKSIWSELLRVKEIKDSDRFFSLGGHSLLVSEMMIKIQATFKLKLTMKELFLNPEFGKFATLLTDKLQSRVLKQDNETLPEIQHLYKSGRSALSWQQQRAWYFEKLNPGTSLFNLPAYYQLMGPLDARKFQKSVRQFIARHLLTRARLVEEKGIPSFEFVDPDQIRIEIIELKAISLEHSKDVALEIMNRDASVPFDLAQDFLFNCAIYTYKNECLFFYSKIHHLIWDGWCYDIFFKELVENYFAQTQDQPKLKCNYPDYVSWQASLTHNDLFKKQIEFWKDYLKGAPPVLELPIDFKRKSKNFDGESIIMIWENDEVQAYERIARAQGTTLFNFMMTAFKIFLARYSGSQDIVVGTPVRGRHVDGLQDMIGFFVNNIAIRTQVSSQLSFVENLKRVSDSMASAFDHPDVPFDEVIRHLNLPRDPTITPVYQTFFMFQDSTNRSESFGDYELRKQPLVRGASHTDLDFWVRRDPTVMKGGFDYDPSLFKLETANRMAEDFRSLLKSIVLYFEKPIRDQEWLSTPHRQLLLHDLNDTIISYSKKKAVYQLFEEQASLYPDRIATSAPSGQLSYREVDEQANQLAHYLRSLKVREDHLIGMACPRDERLPIALLAIQKAGAGYVPLDPDYPVDRLSYMIEHSQLQLVVGTHETLSREAFQKVNKIAIDHNESWWQGQPRTRLNLAHQSNRTCYVIYTSGSTGKPKGVELPQSAVVNFLQAMQRNPGIKKEDVLVAVTTMSFDIAVLEMYLPLISGARVHILPRELSMFGDSLLEEIREVGGTYLQATPATWRQLLQAGMKKEGEFKALCGGEPLPVDLAQTLSREVSELWNMYGPTETTVWSTCHKIAPDSQFISIGKPISNTDLYILNEQNELCPYGAVGELFIGGEGLAKGYLNRVDLTQERFVVSPFDSNRRIYKTGDLARYRQDGLVECLGRNDGQVKVRGHRIELGEIEAIISQHNLVQSQVVIVREDRPGDVRLVAYLILSTQSDSIESELRELINHHLPPYMMPAHFVQLNEFPMTLNGKIDRKLLPAPSQIIIGELQAQDSKPTILSSHSSLSKKLEAIWCQELGLKSIKNEDDFFALGGHSLLSVRLFSRIESELGVNLPLSTLFTHSTFGKMLELMNVSESEGQVEVQLDWSPQSLVALRPTNKNKGLYFFHGVGGNVLNYRTMMNFIPQEYSVFGLQSPGVKGEAHLAQSLFEMAILYAQEIQLQQPSGELVLAGGSMGGLLALETARVLKDQGREISKIVMFDTFGPIFDVMKFEKANDSLRKRIWDFVYYRGRTLWARLVTSWCKLQRKTVPHPIRHFQVEMNNYRLISEHQILPFTGDIYLLRAPLKETSWYSDPHLGWEKTIQGNVYVTYVNYTQHSNFVESPLTADSFKKILMS